MAKNAKQIKKRITSVKSTKKITKSMQMISAVKMQKSVKHVTKSKSYSAMAAELFVDLSGIEASKHPLLDTRKVNNTLMILVSSNRGLCGNFNANVIRKAEEYLSSIIADKRMKGKVLAIGKKSASFAKRHNLELLGIYDKIAENPDFGSILPVATTVIEQFNAGFIDKVVVIYTKFKSSFFQEAVAEDILPFKLSEEEMSDKEAFDYKIEPDAEELLNYLLPRLVETRIFYSVLESSASEHSSRMIAMKNATDAAGEMIDILTLDYNKSRQASITQEVAEITGGAEALVDHKN